MDKALLANINSRQSVATLVAPAPSEAQLIDIIQSALTAPDHKHLQPWRFTVVQGAGIDTLSKLFEQAQYEHFAQAGELSAEQLAIVQKVQSHPYRAPVIIIVRTHYTAEPKVSFTEQDLSTGAAIQNMLLAIHAMGYAAIWRTGDIATLPQLHAKLGYASNEAIAGFIYVGTALKTPTARQLPSIDNFLSWL